MPVLAELRARGHEVAIVTLAGEPAALTALGLEHIPLAPAVEARQLDDWQARTPLGGRQRAFSAFLDRAGHEPLDLDIAIERTRPDALLIDANAWGASAAAEAWDGPAARFQAFPLPMRSVVAPPFGPGLPPARGPVGRVRDRVLLELLLRPLDRAVLDRLNAIRTLAGAPPLASVLDGFAGTLPLLHLSAEPFEYPRPDWPANVHLIGPGTWEPPGGPELDLPGGRPVVLVSVSSEYQADGRLVDCALQALAGEDVTVVATTAANDPDRSAVPANARVVRFAAHGPLLERATAVVCHAGMGITQKALAHGVPVCAVPFGRDQAEVARRVEVAGAGVRLSPRRLDAARLRAAVRETRGRRDGARAVADGFARAGGAARGAAVLESLLRGAGGGGPAANATA